MAQPETDRDTLDLLAEEYAGLCRRGVAPPVGEFAARHPEYAERILALLPSVAMMEQLKRHKRQAQASTAEDTGPNPAADALAGFRPPDRLGDFRIVREIGRGGMGIVYEAEQTSLGRHVAVKVLPRHVLLDPKRLQRFEREAQAAARLHHTNIVPVFGVGEDDGLHYLVMQLIAGHGLDRLIARWKEAAAGGRGDSGPGRWRDVARVGLQAAEALDFAHRQGVLHRDVKPANLLRDGDGVVWVTDFGLAKVAEDTNLTETGDLLGTLRYLAPERLHAKADARSDVYSLGLTLYELITLEPAFPQTSPSALIRHVSEGRPEPPRRRQPEVPRDLETVVLKAIAPEPSHRYPTAAALADDLRRFLSDRPVHARRVRLPDKLWRWCRRNPAFAALTATAATSLFLAAAVGWAGYVTTQDALTRASAVGRAERAARVDAEKARVEAERATRRAAENVGLSLSAFDRLFATLAPDDFDKNFGPGPLEPFPTRPPRGGDREPPPGPPRGRRPTRPDRDRVRGPGPGPPGVPPGLPRHSSEKEAALLQDVLVFFDKFAERNTTNPTLQREAARAYRRVGDLRRRLGRDDQAEDAYLRAVRLGEASLAARPSEPDVVLDLAEFYARAADEARGPDARDAADRRARRAGDLLAAVGASARLDPDLGARRARASVDLATVVERLGRPAEAEARLREAIQRLEASPAAPDAEARHYARRELAELLARSGRPDEARAVLSRSALELRRAASAPRGPAPGVGPQLERLADAFRALGDGATADALSELAESHRPSRRDRRGPPADDPPPGPPP